MKVLSTAALLAVSALALAGCAGGDPGDGAGTASDGALRVVASTSVYGDIVHAIAGDAVEVTSIISSNSQDPHEFEASAADQLTVSRADLLVENGGGYDAFMDTLIEATGSPAPVITAVEFAHDWPAGETPAGDPPAGDAHAGHDHVEGFNEHVWYDPHTIEHVAEAIADELTTLAPDDAATFESGLETFVAGIGGLETTLAEVSTAHAGEKIFVTEPVPLYLTAAAGLENVTPQAFSEAVEEGQDVPPATMLEATRILEAGDVRVVIANAQTGGAETTQVLDTAEAQSIPVVEFSETLPQGSTYLEWMADNIAQLADTLSR
nr:zinc ABC transporter substrate-binding protein [Microbacterium sp.]